MSDAREALVDLIDGAIPDDLPGYRQRYTDRAADAILAAGWTPPTVKLSVEDVARRHSRVSMDGTCICGAVGIGFILGYGEHLVAETLALFPGRTEAEVKAEALREVADWLAGMVGESGPGSRATGYGRAGLDIIALVLDRAARIARGEGS